jgi:2-(3-amino-3-carboxypropyl)histidine synthase
MKLLYIEAQRKAQESITGMDNLPKQLCLVYSIQYKKTAEMIKNILKNKGTKIDVFQQVLGCTSFKSKTPILLIGSGRFHALNLALQNNVPVFIYNSGNIEKIDSKEIEHIRNKKKTALNKFLLEENIGILVSTKPGQENLKNALSIKEKILKKYPEKKAYVFLSNNINPLEFENFGINIFINTACPGLSNDSTSIINIDEVSSVL